MNRPPARVIIDASALLPYWLPEPLSAASIHVVGGSALCAPSLIYFEAGNILWKSVTRGFIGIEQARQAQRDIHDLSIELIEDIQLPSLTLEIAHTYQISFYDAAYVAIGKLLVLPLITADQRLIRAMTGTGHQLIALEDFMPTLAGEE